MSWSMRRAVVVLLGVGVLTSLAFWQIERIAAKEKLVERVARPPVGIDPVDPYGGAEPPTMSITLPEDSRLSRRISAAQDYMKEGKWDEACHLLQNLLDIKEDAFVRVPRLGADGKEQTHWTSVKAEASRLIGTLPPEGLEFYRTNHGPAAQRLLSDALAASDRELLAKVATCYLHTDAGAEAATLLGTLALDRREYVDASLRFERLLERAGADKLPDITLVKAALAFRVAGEKDKAMKAKEDDVWKKLERRSSDGVKVGDKVVALDVLRKELENYGQSLVKAGLSDSPMFRGNPARNGSGIGGPAFLEPAWHVPTFRTDTVKDWLTKALNQQNQWKFPVMPAWFPVTATVTKDNDTIPLVLFRSYYGVHAIDLRTGKLKWESDSRLSLDMLSRDSRKIGQVNTWMATYVNTGPHALWENSVAGTLSTDGQRVYLVDDLGALPRSTQIQYDPQTGQPMPYYGTDKDIVDAMHHNKLAAFDLVSGKILWSIGGRGDKKDHPANELNDGHFLGAPLPMGGKLYALVEKNQELRLVCLDPTKNPDKENPVAWSQALAGTRTKMVNDFGRRIQAVHLSYGEGILVCPTNSGAILAVDLLSRSLVWARPYRDPKDPPPPDPLLELQRGRQPGYQYTNDWKTSAPVIEDGKVVFTAPDGASLFCLNLRDGSPLWSQKRTDDDLYLAGVFNGKVVVVTKRSVRALNLADGKPAWKEDAPTGMPSGQGVASNNVYYLPLQYAMNSKEREPEICAIDLDTGAVVGHNKARKRTNSDGQQVYEQPGNLLFFEGMVISQNVTEVTAYPQMKVQLAKIDKYIAANPNDPRGLTERGQLRLHEGNRAGAIEDLQKALRNDPPEDIVYKTRNVLYEALTELIQEKATQKKFKDAEPFLADYEAVCKAVDDPSLNDDQRKLELRRRQGNYYCLLAKGRESQGQLLEAFEAYTKFGALASAQDELLTSLDEPAVRSRPDVWAQGRINAMLAGAKPEESAPLREKVAKEWKKVKESGDLQQLTDFVVMFGTHFPDGREARLLLAEKLMAAEGTANLLQAELHLLRLRDQTDDPQAAARAVEALARLCTLKGFMEDGAYYYGVLGREFAKVPVRDGKTGADFFNELACDPRYVCYLDQPGQMWAGAKVKATSDRGNYPWTQRVFKFEHDGEPLPFFAKHDLRYNLQTFKLLLTDRTTGEEKWGHVLSSNRNNQFEYSLNTLQQNPLIRFPFYTRGHFAVLPIGHMVYGLDLVEKKVVWEKNLFGQLGVGAPVQGQPQQITIDPLDGTLRILYPNGLYKRVGQVGPVHASHVCLLTQDGLLALDPADGKVLWTRSDVSSNYRVFGDDQMIYMVDVDQNNRAGGSRAVRAVDGVSVPTADFSAAFQNKVRALGRHLLVKETDGKGLVLRFYDVGAGKDTWKREFPAGSTVLRTEDANLAGVVDPDGKLTVIDVFTQKDVLRAALLPKHLEKAQSVLLLQDGSQFYVAINLPPDPANPAQVFSNFYQQTGVRCHPVNGEVYAFDKTTGKVKWRANVPRQMAVLDQFKELPLLLFVSRSYNNRTGQQTMAIKSIDKRTGKLLYDEPETMNPNGYWFHAFNVDRKNNRIELLTQQQRIVFMPEGPAGAGGTDAKPPQGGQGQGKGDDPRDIQRRQLELERFEREQIIRDRFDRIDR